MHGILIDKHPALHESIALIPDRLYPFDVFQSGERRNTGSGAFGLDSIEGVDSIEGAARLVTGDLLCRVLDLCQYDVASTVI